MRKDVYEEPNCYIPNDDPYPLCKGNGKDECKLCCLYEDMECESCITFNQPKSCDECRTGKCNLFGE